MIECRGALAELKDEINKANLVPFHFQSIRARKKEQNA
jgi:hypothetical protein